MVCRKWQTGNMDVYQLFNALFTACLIKMFSLTFHYGYATARNITDIRPLPEGP